MKYRTVNLAKYGFTFYNLFHIEEKGDMHMLLILIQSIQDPVVRNRLTELYEKYYRWLVKKAKDYVIDDAVAEDMVHDVFMRLIQKDEKWRSFNEDQLIAYVVQMTKNRAIDYLRGTKKTFAVSEISETVVSEDFVEVIMDKVGREEMYQIFGRALLQLSKREQMIILQKYIYEETDEKIAARLNIKPGSVPVTVSRVKKKLMEKIQTIQKSYSADGSL